MKHFLLFTAVLAAIYLGSLPLWKSGGRREDLAPFSLTHTGILKGVGIACILWGHAGLAWNFAGIQWVAAVGVSLFLILSGYGIASSWQRNGLKGYWSKRLRKVLLPYLAVFGILSVLFGDSLRTTLEYLSVIRGHWYIAYILGCYALFWAAARLSAGSKARLCRLLFVFFALWFAADTLWFTPEKVPALRARQMLAFPTGVLAALYQEEAARALRSRAWALLLPLGLAATWLSSLSAVENAPTAVGNLLSLVTVFPLALEIVWLSAALPGLFDSGLLLWLGGISYEAFLLQHFLFHFIRRGVPWTLYASTALVCVCAWALHAVIRRLLPELIRILSGR